MEQQLQQMMAAIQTLSAEVQQLKLENTALRQQGGQAARSSEVPPGPLPGGRFDGNPQAVKEFLESCTVQFAFKAAFFPTDRDKVGHMIAQMTGAALAWATPLVTNNNPILDSYPAFCNSIRSMFSRQEVVVASQERLLDLKQGNLDILAYITTFKRMTADTSWADDALITLFRRGLSEELKGEVSRVPRPSNLTEFIALVMH